MEKETFWQKVKKTLFGVAFFPVWHLQRFVPRKKNLWIFGAWRGRNYSDNSKAMFEYVLAHRPDVQAVWMTGSRAVYERLTAEGKPVAMNHSWRGRCICCRAGMAFVTCGLTEFNPKFLNGIRLVWLWHGVPIKQIEADLRAFQHRSWFKKLKTAVRRVLEPWDFVNKYEMIPTTSEYFTPFFCSAFGVNHDLVKIVGTPRTDQFWESGKREKLISEIDREFHSPTKIFYMPTFRDNAPFNPFCKFGFDARKFAEVLERQNMVFIYKGHFYQEKMQGIESLGRRFHCVTDDDFSDLYLFLKDVDVLLTDYSSVYFDFLLLRKPVILAPFDYDEYIAASRPFYFPYEELEGRRARNWDELLAILSERTFYVPSDETLKKFQAFADNRSCERVMRCIESDICL